MIFDLTVLENGIEKQWKYDNLKNQVFDENGIDRLSQYHKEYDSLYPVKGKDTDFSIDLKESISLYISLGVKCNFHCKYCHQDDNKDYGCVNGTPDKVGPFVEMLKQSGALHFKHIVFWGGEPLVYWKTLKPLIEALRPLFPKADFGLVTNGSLLDDDKVEFFNKNGVSVCISYDGENSYRDYSVLSKDNLVKSMKKIVRISVMPCQSEKSDSLETIDNKVKESFGNRAEVSHYTMVRANCDSNQFLDYVRVSDDKLKSTEEYLYNELHSGIDNLKPALKSRYMNYLDSVALGMGVDSIYCKYCNNSVGLDLTVDLDGNLLTCMNAPFNKFGHILNISEAVCSDFYSVQTKNECLNCPYVNACRGGCPLITDDKSEAFRVSCKNLKSIARVWFRTSFEHLFGVYLKSVSEEKF